MEWNVKKCCEKECLMVSWNRMLQCIMERNVAKCDGMECW